MFDVAFSRRMCCSRVWSVSTKPRRPSTSTVSPAIRPGIRRRYSSRAANSPKEGPPKSSRLPSAWPSPTATSTPHSPGERRMPSVTRVDLGDDDRRRRRRRSCAAARAPRRPRRRRRSSAARRSRRSCLAVDRGGPGVRVGDAVLERHLDHVHVVAVGVGAQRLDRVGVKAGAGHEPAAAVVELREIAGGGDRRGPLVGGGVRDGQPGQLRDRRLVLEHHLQPALGDLGLVGRVRRQELGALGQHVDQRGHVVVVHAGAEEAELLLGRAVALGELAEMLVDVLLGAPGRQLERAAEPHGGRDLAVEELLQRGDPDRGEHRLEVLGCDCCVAAQVALSVATRPRGQMPESTIQRGLVGRGVHQRLALGWVREPHLDEPALAVGILVDHRGVVRQRLVDGDDLA